jgi:hypothetical protein
MELNDAAWSAATDCHHFQVLPVLPGLQGQHATNNLHYILRQQMQDNRYIRDISTATLIWV